MQTLHANHPPRQKESDFQLNEPLFTSRREVGEN